MFTGDRSGDVLYAALHAVGLASQPTSVAKDDGLTLRGTRITAPVHCAPPDNKPTPAEREACRHWLAAELALLRPSLRAVVVLGGFGWQAFLPPPRPKFTHGVRAEWEGLAVFGSYHVSQQNTFTGRLTPAMLEEVLAAAGRAAGLM
jgi:uracil-DNA glycosylase